MMPRRLVLPIVLLLVSALAHAERAPERRPDPRAALIGKWVVEDNKSIAIEFLPNGKLVVSVDENKKVEKVDGSYSWVDDETLDVSINPGKKTKTERIKVAFDGDVLVTTDSSGKTEKFKRAK